MIDAIKSRRFALPFAGAFILVTCMLAMPELAWAGIAEDINAWICGVLRDCCNWIFESQVSVLSSIGVDGVLSAGFEQMLGNAGTVTMYSVARGVWEVAILPIGCGVLSFVFTVQLIKISQKMDGNASMPGVKEVVFLLVFFAVFLFIIQNSFDIMQSIYEVTKLAIDRVAGMFGAGGAVDLSQVSIATTEDDVAALIGMIVIALVSWLVVLIAYADRRQLHQELRVGVPGGHHHPRAARELPHRARRSERGERRRAGHRLGRRRPELRAAIPGDVHPAHPRARQKRVVGARHHGRIRERRRRMDPP